MQITKVLDMMGYVSLGRSTALSESLFAIYEIGCPLLILL